MEMLSKRNLICIFLIVFCMFLCCREKVNSVTMISNEELVTVTESSFVLTWITDAPGDSKVLYGTSPGALREFNCKEPATIYHYCEITGLAPGTKYYYVTKSGDGGIIGAPVEYSPGSFVTLTPPQGEFLFQFVTMNDVHVGEDIAGLIIIGNEVINEGFTWPDENNPYWLFMNNAAVSEINQRGADFVIIKGDITSEHKREEFEKAKEIFGDFEMPYLLIRGNHDRVGDNPEDYFISVFDLRNILFMGNKYTVDTHGHFDMSFDYKGLHFITLDSVNLTSGRGEICDEQFTWLEDDLAANTDKKTFVFLHYVLASEEGDSVGFVNLLTDQEDRTRLVNIVEQNSQIHGVFSGHSHRSKVTYSEQAPGVPFVETGAPKEYPGGYVIYRVYSDGLIQNFYRTSCENCRKWTEITRGEYEFIGGAQKVLFGKLEHRNFVLPF